MKRRSVQGDLFRKKQVKIDSFFCADKSEKLSITDKENRTEEHLPYDSESKSRSSSDSCDNQVSEKLNSEAKKCVEAEPKKLENGKRKFQQTWLKDLDWLQYKEGIASCSVCNLFPNLSDRNSKVVQGFSSNFKLETFKKHGKSQQHMQCEEAKLAKEKPHDTPIAKCIKSIDQKSFAHLSALFNAAYYLAKNNRPFSDFKELVMLLSKLDVTDSDKYTNEKMYQEFVSVIAEHLREALISELKCAKYISILIDGSTDKSDEEQLIIYVRYIVNTEVKESFLTIVPLKNCSADGYLQAIREEFSRLGLEYLLNSTTLVGLGTDGAATMIGVHKGVGRKLSNTMNHLVTVHCAAHKLQLSVLQSIKGCKIINDIDSTLITLYKFYMNSPKRLRELKLVSEALEEKFVKLMYLHKIRWVASKVGTLRAVIRDWKSIVVHLESTTQAKGADGNIAIGLLKKLKDFRFLITMHFLCDYLSIFKQLSLIFQKADCLLSQTKVHVEKALHKLEKLKSTQAENEKKFLNDVSSSGMYQNVQLLDIFDKHFSTDRDNIIEAGIKHLKERFIENENEMIIATSIFDTFRWPEGKDLSNFGESEVKLLSQHFASCLDIEEDDITHILDEWYEFKVLGKNLTIISLFERCFSMRDRFPHMTNLLAIVVTLPVSTSCCERGFSTMNIIKTKLRSNLKQDSINSLMFINLNGPSLKDFNPEKSVDKWYFKAKYQRHC